MHTHQKEEVSRLSRTTASQLVKVISIGENNSLSGDTFSRQSGVDTRCYANIIDHEDLLLPPDPRSGGINSFLLYGIGSIGS